MNKLKREDRDNHNKCNYKDVKKKCSFYIYFIELNWKIQRWIKDFYLEKPWKNNWKWIIWCVFFFIPDCLLLVINFI